MKQTARIVDIQGDAITLQCVPAGGCRSCAGNAFCSAKERVFTAVNKDQLDLRVDDTAEYEIPAGQTIGAGFMVLILPLILFLALYFLASEGLGFEHELVKLIFGLTGMMVGFGISYLRKKRGRQAMPVITQVIPDEDDALDQD